MIFKGGRKVYIFILNLVKVVWLILIFVEIEGVWLIFERDFYYDQDCDSLLIKSRRFGRGDTFLRLRA